TRRTAAAELVRRRLAPAANRRVRPAAATVHRRHGRRQDRGRRGGGAGAPARGQDEGGRAEAGRGAARPGYRAALRTHGLRHHADAPPPSGVAVPDRVPRMKQAVLVLLSAALSLAVADPARAQKGGSRPSSGGGVRSSGGGKSYSSGGSKSFGKSY